MRVGKKIFPYPVLNKDESYSSFENLKFELREDLEFLRPENKIIIKNLYYLLEDKKLVDLVDAGLIKVYCVVECSSTIFRKKYEISRIPQNIELDINKLDGQVEISIYGVVDKSIKDFSHENFNVFYENKKFDFQKHNIIFVDDGFTFNVEHKDEDDDKVSSIFNIIKKEEQHHVVEIQPKRKKISIILPKEQFDIYSAIKHNENVQPIMFSFLIIPSLIKILTEIQIVVKEEKDRFNDIYDIVDSYFWFNSIIKRYKVIHNQELTLDAFLDIDIFRFSQELIDMPITRAINEVRDLLKGDDYEED